MIRWFKTMTTNEYIRNVKQNRWKPFDGRLWQRNYYEQIVRDEISLQRVREYIVNNPRQWQQDKLFAEQ
jgi:REP element-mobilizing transposase RayT